MVCYVFTMDNYGKVQEGYNEYVDWVFHSFRQLNIPVLLSPTKKFKAVLGRWTDLKVVMR